MGVGTAEDVEGEEDEQFDVAEEEEEEWWRRNELSSWWEDPMLVGEEEWKFLS